MKKYFILVCFVFSVILGVSQSTKDEYQDGKLILKLKEDYRDKTSKNAIALPEVHKIFSESSIFNINKKFPNHQPPQNKNNRNGDPLVDLSLIYEVEFDKTLDPHILSQKLKNSGTVEYAHPYYIPQLAYSPNDTLIHLQHYLNNIQAFNAWDVTKGDTNVVIAIIDTGVDTDHPDLVGNFAYNYNDPINGIDDDNDGYIDNYLGWDVAMNDNDPEFSLWGHGVNVAGLASASTDNTTGIAGTGFNCKILPVKIDDDVSGQLVAAYDGVIYAADHGADIINNSWGSYNKSDLGQDIVNYATFNKGALVIGAVGNNQQDKRFYPAAYENVLSVGASQENDSIKGNSNYGHWVDVYAPGDAMYTLNVIGGYQYNGGTSMAAPIASGVAALVKSQFPNYTAHQIAQQVITTADNIDALNAAQLQGKLGTGRVNAFRAVTESFSPGIEMHSRFIEDKNDSLFVPGDTLFISGEFTNYLSNATNVTATISVNNNYFNTISASVQMGDLNTLQTKDNFNDPFMLVLKNGIPFNEETEINIQITADNYSSNVYFNITINPDYINVDKNLIAITLTSNGRIGYNDTNLQQGIGFNYKSDHSHLFEASFMIGDNGNRVVDGFRSDSGSYDNDFGRISQITSINSKKADFEYSTIFDDAKLSQPMDIEIHQKNFIFTSPPLDNQVFFVYHIKNTSSVNLTNIYAGIIADWDISNYSKNKVGYNALHRMGVSFSTDTSLYFGIKLLSPQNVVHYAIDNENNGNGGVNILDGFSDSEKYLVLSSMRDSAGGVNPDGNDILDVVSAGPINIEVDSTASVGFVILAAESLSELYTSASNAQKEYDDLSLGLIEKTAVEISLDFHISPIPAQDEIHFKFTLEAKQRCEARVYDAQGKLMTKSDYGEIGWGNYEKHISLTSFRSGIYFLELTVGNKKIRNKFVVVK